MRLMPTTIPMIRTFLVVRSSHFFVQRLAASGQAVLRGLAMMLIFSTPLPAADEAPVEWLIGIGNQWSTAVGRIKPAVPVRQIIDSMKGGLFADAEEAEAWQERVLGFIGRGLMAEQHGTVSFAPGIGLPADQMTPEQFTQIKQILEDLHGAPGEKILCFIADENDQWELWTTECLYAYNHGGGLSRVQKTDYGWNYPRMMFDGEKAHVEVLRYWDLALSNDTMQDIAEHRDVAIFADIVKLVLQRDIEPLATTTIYATDPKWTDRVLQIQNECRQALTARLVKALQKNKPMLTTHAGFRCARWGTGFDETSRLLMPFLLHRDFQSFISSRPVSDIGLFYESHPAITNTVARTIKADLWPAVLTLQAQQITGQNTERVGLSLATSQFAGSAGDYEEFVQTTGIPVAPDFDYWSYATPVGRYTAWFIDDQFYAMQIEPSGDTAGHLDDVMADLTARYGEFTDQPGERGKSRYLHEDAEGGTLVMYETSGGKRELKRIYHYSIRMRPMVNAKLAELQVVAQKQAADQRAAAAKKASQF